MTRPLGGVRRPDQAPKPASSVDRNEKPGIVAFKSVTELSAIDPASKSVDGRQINPGLEARIEPRSEDPITRLP